VSEVTGITFQYHDSDYIGTYFLATGKPGQQVKVLSNELEDEQGALLRWPEWAEYATVVNSMDESASETAPPTFLDDLREKLAGVEELTFLRRSEPPGQA
jgi:hypothetical protein